MKFVKEPTYKKYITGEIPRFDDRNTALQPVPLLIMGLEKTSWAVKWRRCTISSIGSSRQTRNLSHGLDTSVEKIPPKI